MAIPETRAQDPETRGEEPDLERLASLVVEALEIGSGKAERDVGEDLCRTFGVDLREVENRFPRGFPGRKRRLLRALAGEIAGGAGSAARLMTEVVRCGGRFLAMVEEIYAFLAAQRKTTEGTSEEFRFRKEGLELDLPISPAFIERIRHLSRVLQQVETGTIDEEALSRFIGMDGGELYGSWPPGDHRSSLALARDLSKLAWIEEYVERHREGGELWEEIDHALARAVETGGRFMARAERLIRAHAAWLRSDGFEGWLRESAASLEAVDIENLSYQEQRREETRRWSLQGLRRERDLLEREGVLGTSISGQYFVGLPDRSLVGLHVDRLDEEPGSPGSRPAAACRLEIEDDHLGSGVSFLATLVAYWRLGLVRPEKAKEPLARRYAEDPGALREWLTRFEPACRAAIDWLENEVWTATGTTAREDLVESFEDFLNLPLWRHRDLLYEIWLLCATMSAAETGGWRSELSTLDAEDEVWTLEVAPTDEPIARLVLPASQHIEAMVWREPRRRAGDRQLTPDIAISTPGPDPLDLVVVEAKDRYKMSAGGAGGKASKKSAYEVGRKYLAALHPAVTWVCNHCDFREDDVDPQANYGDFWRRLHLGSALRPGNVPSAFPSSICTALRPPGLADDLLETEVGRLVLVLDTTGSMHNHLEKVWSRIREPATAAALEERFSEFLGLLFSDHGDGEPYLLRELDSTSEIRELVDAMSKEPLGQGGDDPEALEDAIRHCRILAESLGPIHVLIVTDAPPHTPEECPDSVDFNQEMSGLLETGSSCFVVDDWQSPMEESTWAPYEEEPGFYRASLADLLTALGEG